MAESVFIVRNFYLVYDAITNRAFWESADRATRYILANPHAEIICEGDSDYSALAMQAGDKPKRVIHGAQNRSH